MALNSDNALVPLLDLMFYPMFYLIKSWGKLLIYSRIQKPYRHYSPVSFGSSLKPPPFEGVNYKRCRARAILCLTTMRCFDATKGKPEGEITPLEEKAFEDADTLLRGAIISVLGENIVDSYLSISTGKDMWDAIEAKFGVLDAGSELYVMEQFYDFKMTNERSIVEQAHEIQSIAKELEQFTCVLPDKFIAGGIIAKLPPSWRNFATSLKHKRQEFSTTDLIGSLDVEEKARAKDTRARGVDGGSSANLVQKKNFQSYKSNNKNKYDGKGKFDGKNKASQSTNFKRKTDKKKGVCHVCGDPDHWTPNCPNRFDKRQQGNGGKTANVVIGDTEMKDAEYGIFPTVLSICHSPEWWIDTGANAVQLRLLPVRFTSLALRFISSRGLFSSFLCAYKRGRSSPEIHYETQHHMRLPLGSRALRRRSRLLHPVYRRAPLDGTAGLRNPVSCDPVRERGDKVFGERSTATAGFNIDTEADDYFPNDDFFPDISNLFSDMALNSDNGNTGSSSGPNEFRFIVSKHIALLNQFRHVSPLLYGDLHD
ncbi:uncharacterized protein [Lolium perenne]|uniref:uncharacterized protein n=1 Tax=Lolium perenne TaxID=4522 RepID=UPI003A99753E